MSSFFSILLIIILGLAGLLVILWALLELFDFIKWVFPTNKDDEAGPFK